MSINKMTGVFAVAIATLAISTPAVADCTKVIEDLEFLKERLEACSLEMTADGNYLPGQEPVWQKRRQATCVINDSLIAQLDAEHDQPPADTGAKKGHKKDPVVYFAKGAINELKNGNYAGAESHLYALIDNINAAKPLDYSDPRPGAYAWAANDAILRINETEGGCYF